MRTAAALPFLALLLAALPAHAESTQDTIASCRGPGMTPPVPLNSHAAAPGDYPLLSTALGENGTTQARYTVLPNGDVGDVRIIQSSGSLRLDDATVTLIKRFKFKPALVNNAPAACANQINVAWSLHNADEDDMGPLAASAIYPTPADFPPGAMDRHEEGSALAVIFVNDNGAAQMVEFIRNTQYEDLNIASVALLRARKIVPAMLDGKPIRSVILVRVVWSPTGKPLPGAPSPADAQAQPRGESSDEPQAKPGQR